MSKINALADIKVIERIIPAFGHTPNSSASNKPLLIYQGVFTSRSSISDMEKHLTDVGEVIPQWRYTMYSQSHFHSTTHELLAIAKGRANLCFGHEDNPGRFEQTVSKGDVIVVPAGVSHRLLSDLDGGFLMVGSYPGGKQWDMCYGHKDEGDKIRSIEALSWFKRDPIYGAEGPVLDV